VRTLVRRLGLRPKTVPIEASAWPWRLELRTFGSFSLAIDGERVAHDGKPQRSPMRLLHALLAHGGRGVPERTLVDALWPEAEGDAGRRVFDTTLHRLRKLLVYPDLLRLEERRLVLDDSAVWTDLWALERRLGELDATPVEHLPGAVERARAAIALYTGPFLADNEDDPSWVIAARDRLRARITAAVGRIVKRLSLSGSGAHAAELAAALTRSDPAIVLRV
jgi:two-component SAPR family response regulator